MTRDFEVLKNLQDLMGDAKKYDAYTQSIEEKFALASFVDSHEQSLVKKRIAQIQGIVKECGKIKLRIPSINYGKTNMFCVVDVFSEPVRRPSLHQT